MGRILIYGINYAPELTGIGKYTGELGAWLAARGHLVRVVTAPPYYPQWSVSTDYKPWRYRFEQLGGTEVIRCPLWVPKRPTGVKRVLHLLTFAMSSAPALLANVFWRPTVLLVIEPAFACIPLALLTARLAKANPWLHIQDFEIDAAFELGIASGPRLRKAIEFAENWLLKRFGIVSTISERMIDRLVSKGVAKDQALLFPNWVDTELIHPLPSPSSLRHALGISPDKVVALYSGNMGEKQGLEIIADAARDLADAPSILFVLCGDGSARARIAAATEGLPNVIFIQIQPIERLNDLLNLADIHLLPQRAGVADLVMPSKLTGMLASGRPVVATASAKTQVEEIVSRCGFVVEPGDAFAFASAIRHLAADPSRRSSLGLAARDLAVNLWGREDILSRIESVVMGR